MYYSFSYQCYNISRLERIKDLKKMLQNDIQFEQDTLQHLKNRADAYVMLR